MGRAGTANLLAAAFLRISLPRACIRRLDLDVAENSLKKSPSCSFLENIALKLVLEHRAVPNWQKLVDHLLADKEMLGGVRLTFRDLYREIEKSSDPAAALEAFLGKLPAQKKTQEASISVTAIYKQLTADS